ncbi:MAG TPA: type II secretion system protein, partial [Candidatus Wallbacteria bacterium]|nr:type II secretion system protein [Candidatus Wallbacteria bacterium]
MMVNNNNKRAFTILELLVAMFLVALLTGPILNTFQVSERLSRRNYKSFASQNLAKEMMNEIAKKSFDDPYQSSTTNVNLKPGPTHEEYIPDSTAPKIANGTDETTNVARLFNETIVNRSKYYNDIDDYDGYNSDEVLLPTLANGKEYLIDGENPYANLRVKVSVKSGTSGALPPQEVLKGGATLGNDPSSIAITPDSKYAAIVNSGDKTVSIVNLKTGTEVDNGPNGAGLSSLSLTPCTSGIDRIPLATLNDPLVPAYTAGTPSKIILGPAGDRFYVLHTADILDPDKYSGIQSIDMNTYNTPEVSFHRLYDGNLISRDLRSNSINSIVVDKDGIVYAATNAGGLSKSADNGETWALQKAFLADGSISDTIYCLATAKYGYGRGDAKFVYAGGKGGLWISKNDGPWNRVSTVGSSNITALGVLDNGYVIAGADDGKVYVSKEYDANFTQKTGPAMSRIHALA